MAFSGRSLCTISNSALFCTTLLKTACYHQDHQTADSNTSPPTQHQRPLLSPRGHLDFSSPRSNGSVARTHSRKSSSGGGVQGVDIVDGGGRDDLGRSKPIPIQRQTSSRLKRDRDTQGFFPNSTCGVGSTAGASYTSPAYFPKSWSVVSGSGGGRGGSTHQTPKSFQSWVIIPEPSDSELSGYEADVERGAHGIELAESCGEMEEEGGRVGELLQSLTSCLVPPEVQKRVWILQPIWYCIDLLRENVSQGLIPLGWVIFLMYTFVLSPASYVHCIYTYADTCDREGKKTYSLNSKAATFIKLPRHSCVLYTLPPQCDTSINSSNY